MSFVVGEYVKIEDSYKDIPVNYWVYEENKNETMRSFGLTTDMMRYFDEYTDVPYPYEKYDQIILDDFMFGGMENITLTHNTDRTMHDQFSVPDQSSVGLVAHELAHQWFGDMLTTRNWANIWLNEGFATFFSRKYREEKFGHDEESIFDTVNFKVTLDPMQDGQGQPYSIITMIQSTCSMGMCMPRVVLY